MKRLLLLATLALSACVPSTVDIPATAEVAIRLTDAALPTNTAALTATPASTPTPAPSPTPSLDVGSSQIRSTDGAMMMYVPAGEFTMGYDQGNADETPAHTVFLDSFWIDKTEITVGMYDACITAGKCPRLGSRHLSKDLPIVNGEWQNADAYCSYAAARLPTEAEWEKAARGTDGRLYPWGVEADGSKMSAFNSEGRLPPVGSVPEGASPYGVLDMAGSAFEWVADWYSPSYYATAPHENPLGPSSGAQHVIRGGWFEWTTGYSTMANIRTTYRSTFRSGTGNHGRQLFGKHGMSSVYDPGAGFRCAQGS